MNPKLTISNTWSEWTECSSSNPDKKSGSINITQILQGSQTRHKNCNKSNHECIEESRQCENTEPSNLYNKNVSKTLNYFNAESKKENETSATTRSIKMILIQFFKNNKKVNKFR